MANHSTSRCRSDNSLPRASVDGVLDRRISNLLVLLVHLGFITAVATCVEILAATPGIIQRMLSLRRHRQPCLAKCVAGLVVM